MVRYIGTGELSILAPHETARILLNTCAGLVLVGDIVGGAHGLQPIPHYAKSIQNTYENLFMNMEGRGADLRKYLAYLFGCRTDEELGRANFLESIRVLNKKGIINIENNCKYEEVTLDVSNKKLNCRPLGFPSFEILFRKP